MQPLKNKAQNERVGQNLRRDKAALGVKDTDQQGMTRSLDCMDMGIVW